MSIKIGNIDVTPKSTDVYSETEQTVGIWIDGRPIYRKVIHITNLPTARKYNRYFFSLYKK